MTLWVVRHAQPLVAAGTCYGQWDVGAQVQATALAASALAEVLPLQAHLSVSPLQRCMQLAQALCALRPDLQAQADPRLMEMNFGQWEGVPWSEIPRLAIDDWTENFAAHCFGGGESVAQVMQRVAQAWDDAAERWQQGQTAQVWISHAGVARAAQLLAQGQRQVTHAQQWPLSAPPYGGYVVLPLTARS